MAAMRSSHKEELLALADQCRHMKKASGICSPTPSLSTPSGVEPIRSGSCHVTERESLPFQRMIKKAGGCGPQHMKKGAERTQHQSQ
jgi:hypothetical protein